MKKHLPLVLVCLGFSLSFGLGAAQAASRVVFDPKGSKVQIAITDDFGKTGDARKLFDLLRVAAVPGKQVVDKDLRSPDQNFAISCEKTLIMNITGCGFEILAGPTSVIDPTRKKASYRVSNVAAQELHQAFGDPGQKVEYRAQNNIRIISDGIDFEFYFE